jgi:hypothetical protein
MGEGDGKWAKVEGCGWPGTFGEVTLQGGVGVKKLSQLNGIVDK